MKKLILNQVTLEDLYQGATRKLALQKNVICSKCDGLGGKRGSVQKCTNCRGTGMQVRIQQLGPGMVQQIQSVCSECRGEGEVIDPKNRCKVCKGKRIVKEIKILEVHIDKGELIKHQDVKCVMGEGMPVYRDPFEKGRLIIQFNVNFPPSGTLSPQAIAALEDVLPPRQHNTIIMERGFPLPPDKEGEKPDVSQMNEIHKILHHVETSIYPQERDCLLIHYVEGLGIRGDIVKVPRTHFHEQLYPFGLATFASPDNIQELEKEINVGTLNELDILI